MNIKGLSLNTIPPVLIPLRFFLTAPFFGILAALLIILSGSEIWTSRWLSSTLALTHLLTIGFMLMVMYGALYQFIPVMIGQQIPASKKLSPVIHLLLTIGTLSLSYAFLSHNPFFYWLALITLGIAVLLFALSLLPLLIAILSNHLIVFLLRILFLVLVVTLGLGLYMLLAYAYPELDISYRSYTDVHALWGLIGWVVLLIVTVSSQVIPMFYVTPEFSVRYLKVFSLLIIATLIVISFLHTSSILMNVIFSVELIFFALYTLQLINRRKRKVPDITIRFIYMSFISLLAVVSFWWFFFSGLNLQLMRFAVQFEFIVGILLIYGLALSAIIGMLQKIVAFLIYLHLQNLSFKHPGSAGFIPNMKTVISNRDSQIQFMLHLSSYLLLILSVFFTQFTCLAGLVMLANFVWLSYILFQGFALYTHNKVQILSYPEMDFQIK